MLERLYIENIAVIEKAEIDFTAGFNILTGETGAGKSIIIDSLGLLLGQRASRDMIRTGADRAFVSAVFSVCSDDIIEQLNQFDIQPDEDHNLYIERNVRADGHGIVKINGRPVPLTVLKELSPYLVTIHGQHMNQRIMNPATHLSYVDSYGNYHETLAEYQSLYQEVSAARKELIRLQKQEQEKTERIDILSYHVKELQDANLLVGEDEELLEWRNIAAHAEKIAGALSESLRVLSDQENSADDLLLYADSALEQAGQFSEEIKNIQLSLKDIIFRTEDTIAMLRDYQRQMSYSAGTLDEIEERLALIKRLKAKYGGSIESALQELEKSFRELEELEFSEENLAKQQQIFQDLASKLAEKSIKLTEKRVKTGEKLAKYVMEKLAFLDMDKCRFVVQITPSEKFTTYGHDVVEFYISANPGESPKPLAKTASGGELSRIMLAIIQVLSEKGMAETMIFDEVDSGVSGKTAQKIGILLKSVSKKSQVLCVTHLAQIAAMADQHLYIRKNTNNNQTYTEIHALDQEARRREVARIIGGLNITESALQTADELMKDGQF